MKIDNIIAPICVAAITAVAALLYQFNSRLTRIEATLDTLAPIVIKTVARTP